MFFWEIESCCISCFRHGIRGNLTVGPEAQRVQRLLVGEGKGRPGLGAAVQNHAQVVGVHQREGCFPTGEHLAGLPDLTGDGACFGGIEEGPGSRRHRRGGEGGGGRGGSG
ncbi:MAG: hypothetical protein DRI37_01115 [Chloroflexi bacterium]|nr:MAG: hypothetical protein DRI37_01115 [Chloroflexota bacterium]